MKGDSYNNGPNCDNSGPTKNRIGKVIRIEIAGALKRP